MVFSQALKMGFGGFSTRGLLISKGVWSAGRPCVLREYFAFSIDLTLTCGHEQCKLVECGVHAAYTWTDTHSDSISPLSPHLESCTDTWSLSDSWSSWDHDEHRSLCFRATLTWFELSSKMISSMQVFFNSWVSSVERASLIMRLMKAEWVGLPTVFLYGSWHIKQFWHSRVETY